MSAIQPTKNPGLIIDDFILYATSHLSSVSGIVNTVSLYPPLGTPGPGIVQWSGYQIPPASSAPQGEALDTTPIQLSEEQLAVANLASLEELPISEATARAFESNVEESPPPFSYAQTERMLEESLSPAPIPEPSKEELEAEGANTTELSSQTNTTTQVPNYKTNVKVPDDVVLAMRRWGVGKDPRERAHFLSQCAHESGGFRLKVENLNYSTSGLLGVFPKYFPSEDVADGYARKPELIASKVYGNRMGNGSEASKEGWKYRGRGYIQLTGKSNYTNAEKVIKGGIVNNPDLVEKNYPGDTACYFWVANNLKRHVSTDNDLSIKKLTKSINGGDKGIDDRKKKFVLYWNELQKDPTLWA